MSTEQNKPETTNKGLSLFIAAVPVLIALFLSVIAYFAGFFLSVFTDRIGTSSGTITTLTSSEEGWVYLIQYLLYLVFFGIWYWHILQKKEQMAFLRRHSEKKGKSSGTSAGRKKSSAPEAQWNPVAYWAPRLLLLFVFGYAIQILGTSIISILSNGFPDLFSSYKELIRSMAGTGIDPKTFIAVSFLAPIAEELMFRGVSYHYARTALSYRWAILIQALLFGIYHGNLIQFIYATLIGLILGTLRRRAGSIVPGIVLHIIINLTAYLVPEAWIETLPKAGLMAGIALLVILPSCFILLRNPKRRKSPRAEESA